MGKEKVLFLGYEKSPVIDWLRTQGYEIVQRSEKLGLEDFNSIAPEHVISYGYRHIIAPNIIAQYPEIVNLHIAFLPWNRGVDPNFWSWLENTPKGVTIHYIDEGVDTGPILVQKKARFKDSETLSSSYGKLRKGIEELFIDSWGDISKARIKPKEQPSKGTLHYAKDLEKYRFLLKDEWDTLVDKIRQHGKENGLWIFNENGVRIK
jgi:methionyl-tRNA formyltransferase